MRGNLPVRFGKGPTEKDPNHGHLAGGLFHLTGGSWKRSLRLPRQLPTLLKEPYPARRNSSNHVPTGLIHVRHSRISQRLACPAAFRCRRVEREL
jgi:hypothetical protein